MACNPNQFQQGLSLPEFLQCFGTKAACAEAVRRARWPNGFCCPRTDARCTHCVQVVGQRKPRAMPQFKWVNTVLGNLKAMLSGAYKSFGCAKYADRYLGAFAYRFNRRFDLAGLVVRPIVDVSRGKAAPERVIRHA